MSDLQFKFLKRIGKATDQYEGGPILVHGVYASGKTHFLGDAIQTEKDNGLTLFANVAGEDGMASAAPVQALPANQRLDIESYEAAEELISYATASHCHLLAVDSLPLLYDLAIRKVTKGSRVPMMTKEKNEWTHIHVQMENLMLGLRRSAKYVIVVAPSALGIDLVKDREDGMQSKQMIVPDMPGKFATQCMKWFDFVGYLKADKKGPNMVREIHLAKTDKWLTRQRTPNEILEPISIPQSSGGWQEFKSRIEQSYQPKGG